jgi:uncharacterized protein YwgA
MGESIFKYPTLIGYLVKRIKEKLPDKQVGKIIVQKMLYLLTREVPMKFDYSMYHYGPYSSEVSQELDFAENSGIVEIDWVDKQGYFIKSTDALEHFEPLLTEEDKHAIEKIVEGFYQFNAIELSIIATAFFLKDNFEIPETHLAKVIHTLKKNRSLEFIETSLKNVGLGNS